MAIRFEAHDIAWISALQENELIKEILEFIKNYPAYIEHFCQAICDYKDADSFFGRKPGSVSYESWYLRSRRLVGRDLQTAQRYINYLKNLYEDNYDLSHVRGFIIEELTGLFVFPDYYSASDHRGKNEYIERTRKKSTWRSPTSLDVIGWSPNRNHGECYSCKVQPSGFDSDERSKVEEISDNLSDLFCVGVVFLKGSSLANGISIPNVAVINRSEVIRRLKSVSR